MEFFIFLSILVGVTLFFCGVFYHFEDSADRKYLAIVILLWVGFLSLGAYKNWGDIGLMVTLAVCLFSFRRGINFGISRDSKALTQTTQEQPEE